MVVFVGGFMDETFGNAVVNAEREIRDANPGISTYRFAHDQGDAIERLIRSQPPGTRVRLIGHSWGGNTAAEIADRMGTAGHPLDMLVTVDPVGNGTNTAFYERVRQGTRRWVNVNATGGSSWDFSNLVRRAGTPYDSGPMGHAHEFLPARVEHSQFSRMLRERTSEGRSLLNEIIAR